MYIQQHSIENESFLPKCPKNLRPDTSQKYYYNVLKNNCFRM